MPTTSILLADVGGTNTRVALSADGVLDRASIRRYPSRDYPSVEAVLRAFMTETGATPSGAAVAVAGPVRDGRAELTNLGWHFDGIALAEALALEGVLVINDLQAQGHAIGHIAAADLRPILPGKPQHAGQSKLVVGVGTGFNAAPVIETAAGRVVAPAECGHSSMPVIDAEMAALATHLRDTCGGFASIEHALSGAGLGRLFGYVSGTPRPSGEVLAMVDTDADAARAVEIFVTLLGTVLGDLALTFLPFGGIYLTGGMARAVSPWYGRFGLGPALAAKGRLSGLMEAFSVSVIEDDYAALAGLAAAGAQG